MADKTIAELQQEQESLQEAHDKAQKSFMSARTKYAKTKEELTSFNSQYGRMLKVMVIDPDAEPDELPEQDDGAVNTSNEE